MSVIVPYVAGMLHPHTETWAQASGATLWELDPAQDDHYWTLLAGEWATVDEDLVIVEQDMVPARGVTLRMQDCRRRWCVSPYRIANGWLTEGLGCTRFAARLKQRQPDLLERVGRVCDDGTPARDWRRLDTRIARVLRAHGYAPHTHARSTHHHDYAQRP